MSAARKPGAATPETAAIIPFEAWDAAEFGPVPSLDEWLKRAQEDHLLMRVILKLMVKSKDELIAFWRDDPESATDLLQGVIAAGDRYKAGERLMTACTARLFVVGSVVAVDGGP